MSARPEYQIRGDWEFCPALWTLNFASRVNTGVSLGITRAVQKNKNSFSSGVEVRREAAGIYQLLQHGEYVDSTGVRRPVKGDLSKMHSIVGLTEEQKKILHNIHFMSNQLPGTRDPQPHTASDFQQPSVLRHANIRDDHTKRATFGIGHQAFSR